MMCVLFSYWLLTLCWRHNRHDSVPNQQPHDRLLNRLLLFRRRSKKTSRLRVTGLCEGNSPGTGEFPKQSASNPENVSIWLRNHNKPCWYYQESNCHSISCATIHIKYSRCGNSQNVIVWFCQISSDLVNQHLMAFGAGISSRTLRVNLCDKMSFLH